MKKWVAVIWCCFVVRGAFYASAFPLWEGFDEWAHFGVIERMRLTASPLIDRGSLVSEEVTSSFFLVPMPRGMTNMPPGAISHQEYWSLPAPEREARQKRLQELSPGLSAVPSAAGVPAYEASQPPLYYALLAFFLAPFGAYSLVTRLWIARFATVLIASLAIPIAFRIFRGVWKNDYLALAGTAFIAAAPALVMTEARVSNESLGLVAFTLLFWAELRGFREPTMNSAVLVGVTAGIGLLTKAYFLTAIPAIVAIYLFRWHRHRANRRALLHTAVALTVALGIGGWWYVRNIAQTGTLSGLDEALMLKEMPVLQRISGLYHVRWVDAIATIVLSHVWYGGWSLLALPRKVYYAAFLILGAGLTGFVRGVVRRPDSVMVPFLLFYAFFWMGQLYQVLLLFLSKGSSTAMGGWYLHAMTVAEVVLLFSGWSCLIPKRGLPWIFPVLTALLVLMDFYGLQYVSLPFFAQSAQIVADGFSRLAQNKPIFLTRAVLMWQWIGFLVTTFALLIVAVLTARRVERSSLNDA